MADSRLTILFEQLVAGRSSPAEEEEWQRLILDPANREEINQVLDSWISTKEPEASLSSESRKAILGAIFRASPGQKPLLRWLSWQKIAVAASILLLLSAGGLLLLNRPTSPSQLASSPKQDLPAPQTTRAHIILGNGKTIYLDSTSTGTIAQQGETQLIKRAPDLVEYQGLAGDQEITWNLLVNPRGSRIINLLLTDGSRVWLNAGSSIRYPIAFGEGQRKVSISGEAYFEIARKPDQPFQVQAGSLALDVLGTRFNIDAYNDEDTIRTTLLEGAVRVRADSVAVVLRAGEQAGISNGRVLTHAANIDEVMAWKEGLFDFEQADLKGILRQVSRWYDVEVIYEGPVKPRKFFGIVKRSSTLNSVLELLQDNNISYRIQGRKLIVKAG